MSLDEARNVRVQFSSGKLVPPPRSVDDVMTVIAREHPGGPDEDAARATADQAAPDISDPKMLSDFYFLRGVAARELGRVRQAHADFTRANQLATSPQIVINLGRIEATAGHLARALEHWQWGAQVYAGSTGHTTRVYFSTVLTRYLAWTGDLEGSAQALGECLRARDALRRIVATPPDVRSYVEAAAAHAQAEFHEARGHAREAEQFRREAIRHYRSGKETGPATNRYLIARVAQTELAMFLAHEGRLLEAEDEARQALMEHLRSSRVHTEWGALILRNFAAVIAEQGRYPEAERLTREVLAIYERMGVASDAFVVALARDQLAAILAAMKRWSDAIEQYEQIRTALADDPEAYSNFFRSNVTWALALMKTGHPQAALGKLEAALERSRRAVGDAHPTTAEIRGLLGAAHLAIGNLATAAVELREATSALLSRPTDDHGDETGRSTRDLRFALITESYLELLGVIRGTPLEQQLGLDAAAEAFRVADVARARTVQRALDAMAARATAEPGLRDVIRREQDLRKQINALYVALANATGGPAAVTEDTALRPLRHDLDRLREAADVLSKEIAARFPRYHGLVDPRPASVEDVRRHLRGDESLIATFVADERIYVWAVPPRGPLAFAGVALSRGALEALVARVRRSVDSTGVQTVSDIPMFDVEAAHDLYRDLLAPVSAGWRAASHLLVVAHGPLGQLPFAVLVRERPPHRSGDRDALFSSYRDVPWLIRTHAVTVLPAATSLGTLRSLAAGSPDRRPFVGFGDPYFSAEQARAAQDEERTRASAPAAGGRLAARSPTFVVRDVVGSTSDSRSGSPAGRLPRLPDTADEIRGIARAMGADLDRDVFLGVRANEGSVKSLDFTRYRVVAFATHGIVSGDIGGLTQPALALTAPEVAHVEGDGFLTMEEILELRLNTDWVVLSACSTASGNGEGAEALSGLGRAFFYAGARAVLVTHWPVETTSARALTTGLFSRQAGPSEITRAQALRQTMNWMIDDGAFTDRGSGRVVFRYAHPIFWAPFALVGDGG
jgi:CHAT domain-containing protein